MKTKQEIKDWLLQNAVNEYGHLDLSGIDFGNLEIRFDRIKANYIDNSNQEATNRIYNHNQKARNIYNHNQEANRIYNHYQEATNIYNYNQKADYIYNYYQESNYIRNHSQKATNIYNSNQEATNIYNYYQESGNIYNKTNAIIDGKEYKVDFSDEIYTIILKSTTRNGLTIIDGMNRDKEKVWVYKNDFVSYHAKTKEKCKNGFKRKLKGFEANIELINKIKEQGYITREEYHTLTGACEYGINEFAKRIGKEHETKLTIKELKKLLQPNDYGYNMIMKWIEVE